MDYKKTTCTGDQYTAHLDHDARQGLGPETITLDPSAGLTGQFAFKVIQFSSDGHLYGSGAHVAVYGAAGLLRTATIPAAYASPPETCGPRNWSPFTAVFQAGSATTILDNWAASAGADGGDAADGRRRQLSEGAICPTPWLTPKSLHAAVNEQAVIATAVAAGAIILLVCCLLLGFVLLQRRKRSTPLMLEHQVQKDGTEMVAAT